MCGGAIISDFIAVKQSRNLTAEDLWSELDTFSDLLGLNYNGKYDSFDNKVGPNAKQPKKAKVLNFDSEVYRPNKVVESELELKEQISSLESFLGLEPEAETSEVSGSGETDSVDLWMLDDLVTHHQQHRQLIY
ncbi:ethylene-responsive transcription factor RAP2-3 [Corchorus olitorius]|uniref:Ethylene-responsive transcription factor RAP2-3 n=1 Tax=Corchorus olitorius TaxID=93759 RepID=A0A1R3JUN0_9ROSI|nr:ethylene-responsive transcription factor RAP2-3 [Corchorus olitorius]